MSTSNPLIIRPRRIAIYGAIVAAVVLGAMIVLGLMLKSATEGMAFRTSDQVGLISVGVAGAAAIMLVARPRVRADATGMMIRNILGENYFPWTDVRRIAFPAGAHWARVVLLDGDNQPILAIQALDTDRAVRALTSLRELCDAHRPPPAEPSPAELDQERRRIRAEAVAAAARPLGRLEIIDRRKAEQQARRRKRPSDPA